jgi:hypothetical protein
VAQGGLLSHDLFSLYANYIPSPSRYGELEQYAPGKALVTTFCILSLLVYYLEAQLGEKEGS